VALSLGSSRQDGVKSVSFRISHRPDVQYGKVRQISIIYDKISGTTRIPSGGGNQAWSISRIGTSGY
jgi:hypothetical protein